MFKKTKKKLKKLKTKFKKTKVYQDAFTTVKILKKDVKEVGKSSRKYKRKIDHFLLSNSKIKIG